jgi:hypothetical protein
MISGGHIGLSVSHIHQLLLSPFKPLGVEISEGVYRYTNFRLWFGSDPSKKISYKLRYDFGEYYDGKLDVANVAVQIVPIPNISLKLQTISNYFKGVGTNEVNTRVSLHTVNANFVVNPRLQLAALYQRNEQYKLDAFNVRFSWEYKPLSFIYLVWNSRAYEDTALNDEQKVNFKVNFVKQL